MKRAFSSVAALFCLLSFESSWSAGFAQTTGEIAKGNARSCAQVCQQTVDYCNHKRGKLSDLSLLNSIKDCITSCKSVDELLSRSSTLSPKSAKVCIDACNECAKACDQVKDDKQLTKCANECRKTASNMQKLK